MKDQTSYGFNADGYLVWMKDRYGNTVDITVDNQGRVHKITDTVDREYNITYENGKVKSITDPAGRSVIYEYESGNLVRVKDSDGNYTRYSYDSEGFLTQIRDHNNNVLETIAYLHGPGENRNKVDYTIDAYGNKFTYSYNNILGETTITDSNNRQTIKRYDSSYSITNSVDAEGRTVIIEYFKDENNINRYWEEKSVTDRNGNKTQYQRDSNGNITKITNPDLSYKEMGYDDKNNMIWEKDETGRFTYYIYDSEGINLMKVVQPLDGITEYIDGVSNENDFSITSYSYYADSECQELGYKAKGLIKSVADPEGNTTTYTYDVYGNVVSVEDPETHQQTIFEYNSIGWKEAVVSPEGYRTEYDYDNNGRLIRTIQAEGETTRIVYNPMGQIIQEVSPNLYSASHDDMDNNKYTVDHGTRYTYYPSGDIHTITDAENNTTTYTYDCYGNIKTETKPNGAIYTFDYDIMNRVIKVWFQNNAESDAVLLEEYEYSIMSNKNTRTTKKVYINDSETLTTIYTYDYAGRLITQQNPDGTVQTQEYYPNGTLKSITDPKQNKTYYKYDGQNHLSEQWSPIENNNGIKYNYKKITYDKAGRQKQILIGKELVSLYDVPSSFAVTEFTYYRNGLVRSRTDNEGRRIEYRYDTDGNLAAEDIYIDDIAFETTEYENNHMGKPVEERKYIRKGDLYGNAFSNNETETIYTWFTYDENGNLKSVTNNNGITTTYNYDNMNRQTSVSIPGEDEYGMPVVISNTSQYNWEGKVIYNEDANGNITSLEYDGRGFLTKIINADGGVTAFWYDRAGRKTAEVSPVNYEPSKTLAQMNRKEYCYDSMGRLLTEAEVYFDEAQNQWVSFVSKAYQYDVNGNVTKELDALGYEYGTGTTIQQKINSGYGTEYTYNLNNQVISVPDPVSKQKGLSYTVKYTYDAMERVITETNAKGHIISYEYDDAGNLLKKEIQRDANSPKETLETNNYDYLGRLIAKTDGNLNTTYFEYNGFNKLRKEIYPGDESIPAYIIQYQYDELGNLKLIENSLGTQNIYTYDNLGRQTSHTSQKQDGTESIITYVKYDPNGNVRFETDGNGNTTEKTYDPMNRLETVKITVSGVLQTTSYTYDKNSNLLTETDWRNNTYTNVYDPLNRLIEKRDPYNKIIEKLEYNHNHAQIKSYDALGNLTQYEYDRNNRLIKTIDPELNETTQTYDHLGNIAACTDGRGNTTSFYYDEMNRIEKVINARGEETTYTYDLNGNMLTQEDGNGHITTFEYNCVNLVVKRIDHGGRTGTPGNYTYDMSKVESYTYYADGSLMTKTDRNGATAIYSYDCHGRLISESVSGSTVSFTYDGNGNQITVTDNTGTTVRTYDELNRVTSKTVPDVGTVYHIYDIINGVETGELAEQIIDPKGNVTTKIYDRAGRLKVVIDGGLSSPQRTVYEYYDNGTRASVTYPTGIKEEYTYYPDNTLWTLTNKYTDGTVMDVYTYTYDNANNQVSKHEVINGVTKGTTYYTYDALNRLLTVTEPTGRVTAYTYDMAGNRLTETITSGSETVKNTYSYNEQNRLEYILTSINNAVAELTAYTYDSNGNQLETINTEYVDGIPQDPVVIASNTYDERNQLIRTITSEGTTVINSYSGEGLRVSKTVNSQTTYYLYEYDKVVLEVDSDGTQKARNLYGINLLMRTVDNETYYYIYNGHADVTALIDMYGNIAATYYYDAFGNILEQTGDADNYITYAGYQYDEETGLYYLNARMYDPKIARFLQEDTYRGDPNDPLSLNLYTYCKNNPLVYYDPTGHIPEWLEKGIKHFKSGFETLFLKSEEERDKDFNLIYEYGEKNTYTKVVTAIGGGLAETGDFWKDPVAQMEETNQVFEPFITDTLGIKEGTGAYNAIKGIGTSMEAFSCSGVEMIKSTVGTGFAIGSFIGNRTVLDINTVRLVTGNVSGEQYIKSLETVLNDIGTIKGMPGAMVTGIKNSVVNLATNGLDFFSSETSLAEKTQLVTDFTTVVGTAEAAYGLYKVSKPYLSALRQKVSSSNWYKHLASERGSISIGNKGTSNAAKGIDSITGQIPKDKPVVVIGESMGRVNPVAEQLKQAGFDVKTYNPKNFRSSLGNLNRLDVEANRSWIRYWTQDKGATVIDIGIDPSRTARSPFYGVEYRSIYQNWNYPNTIKYNP